jgi:hypothetical protein
MKPGRRQTMARPMLGVTIIYSKAQVLPTKLAQAVTFLCFVFEKYFSQITARAPTILTKVFMISLQTMKTGTAFKL